MKQTGSHRGAGPAARRGVATPRLLALLLLLALVGVATAMVGVLEERALSATTTGEVVSGETESLSAGGERCSGTIVFEVDGREWQTTDRVGGACPADGGESAVEVRYDPDSPYVAETGDSDEGPLGLTVFAGLASALLLVLLVRSLLARRRSRTDGTAARSTPTGPDRDVRRSSAPVTPPRRAARTERVLAPGWFGYLLNGGLAAGAVVLALVRDVPVPLVAVTLVPAVLVGLGAGLVPRFGMPLLVVAFIVSTGITGELGLDRGVALVPPAGLFLGFTLALSVRYRRQQAARPPAPGPPGPGRVHARWDEGEEDVVVEDADAATALDAVRRLDGRTRSVVTLRRPPARLDVAGDAAGVLTTHHCADTTARRPRWRHLASTTGPDDEVDLRLAGGDGHLPRHRTTTLDPALSAVASFADDGGADPALPWSDDDPDGETRPPALQVTDRDP